MASSKYKVAMLGWFKPPSDVEQGIFGETVDVIGPNEETHKYDIAQLSKYNGLVMWHHGSIKGQEWDDLLKLNPHFKGLVRIGAGFDNVDINAAAKNGVTISNVPDYGTEEVADSAMCLLLMLARRYFHYAAELKYNNVYANFEHLSGSRRLAGLTCGIIGLGRIGTCFAVRAKAFGLKVAFYDPFVTQGMDKALGIKRFDSLEEMLKDSDIISVNCLLNQETKHMINKETVKLMKKGSFLINTARGAIVQEEAIVEALQSGHLAGVGLDVLEHEPYNDGHLKNVPNLIVTPHCAFYSMESFVEMRVKAAQELKRILEGEKPKYRVN